MGFSGDTRLDVHERGLTEENIDEELGRPIKDNTQEDPRKTAFVILLQSNPKG